MDRKSWRRYKRLGLSLLKQLFPMWTDVDLGMHTIPFNLCLIGHQLVLSAE